MQIPNSYYSFAQYCHQALTQNRQSSHGEQVVDNILKLFANLQQKDMFLLYHQQFLAQRLIYDTSFDDQLELSLNKSLRLQVGSSNHHISLIQIMLNDIALSKSINQDL